MYVIYFARSLAFLLSCTLALFLLLTVQTVKRFREWQTERAAREKVEKYQERSTLLSNRSRSQVSKEPSTNTRRRLCVCAGKKQKKKLQQRRWIWSNMSQNWITDIRTVFSEFHWESCIPRYIQHKKNVGAIQRAATGAVACIGIYKFHFFQMPVYSASFVMWTACMCRTEENLLRI